MENENVVYGFVFDTATFLLVPRGEYEIKSQGEFQNHDATYLFYNGRDRTGVDYIKSFTTDRIFYKTDVKSVVRWEGRTVYLFKTESFESDLISIRQTFIDAYIAEFHKAKAKLDLCFAKMESIADHLLHTETPLIVSSAPYSHAQVCENNKDVLTTILDAGGIS